MEALKLYPVTRIFKSKMNNDLLKVGKYKQAELYLKNLEVDKWYNFSELPAYIAFEVVELIDDDKWGEKKASKWCEKDTPKPQKKTIINEFYTAFKIITVDT